MDYAKIASQVIEHVGGKQTIKSVQHCATRLRLQLKDNDLRNEDAVSDIEGVRRSTDAEKILGRYTSIC